MNINPAKNLSRCLLTCLMLLTMPKAHAALLDFEPPAFTQDNPPGDYAHTYHGVDGDIDFNGRIHDQLSGGPIADHTTGTTSGAFLKNTRENAVLTFDFLYDVDALNFYYLLESGFKMNVVVEDIGSTALDTFTSGLGDDAWHNLSFGGYGSPIRRLVFSSVTDNDRLRGNHLALDDINISASGSFPTAIPEPSAGLLLILGLALCGMRFKPRTCPGTVSKSAVHEKLLLVKA